MALRSENVGYYEDDVEAYEADDEAATDDEGFEAVEAGLDDEADDESLAEDDVEAYEADDEAATDDEGFTVEADDPESDAGGEPENAAAAQQARIQKMRTDTRNRQARYTQQAATQYATKVQQRLDQQLGKIQAPAPVGVNRIDPIRGSGVVTARLPNGRTTQLMLSPPLATQRDVNRLTQQITINDARQAKAIRVQGKTIVQLKSAQAAANRLHKAEILKISQDLNKRITAGDAGLDKRIAKETAGQKTVANKQGKRILRQIHLRQEQSTWNDVLIASALPLFAAYGDRAIGSNANPFTNKNLILTGSLAFWLFSDDIFSRWLARDSKSWRSVSRAFSVAAPVLNAATVYFFMKDKQHERFITGVETITGATLPPVDLKKFIGSDDFEAFKALSSPRAVATIRSATSPTVGGVQASVKDGLLTLTLLEATVATAVTGTTEVAWAVDTMDPANQRSSS